MGRKSQQVRTLEIASKKRSRGKESITQYFTSLLNFDPSAGADKASMPSTESLVTNGIGVGVDAEGLAAAAVDGLVSLSASVDALSTAGPS
jgi:hypothetical protein